MPAPLVIAAVVALLVILIALLGLTAWTNSETEACLDVATSILQKVEEARLDKTVADVVCPGIKSSITQFENQCSGFSIPTYEAFVPPCS